MAFVETIAAWLKVYDGARFRSEMDRAAESEGRLGAAAKAASAQLATQATRAKNLLSTVGGFGRKLSAFGQSWTTHVGLPLLGIAAISTHLAVNFDAAMVRIQTQAGGSAREVRVLRGEVLELARTLPQSPQELAEGLYHLESIGLRGAKAMRALRIAAEGAAVGNADLEQTASALGGAWLTNIRGAGNLRHVMGLLNATVGAGNTRMEELVLALGTGVLPSAKVAGLGIEDVMSAMAVFTDENYQASSAMAQFATALHFLYAPTRKAEGALEALGLEASSLARDMHRPRGLLVALTDLHDHLRRFDKIKQERLLGEILPGGRGRVLLVLLNQLERLEFKYRQIAGTTGKFPEAVERTRQTPKFRLHSAISSLEASGIELGAAILPAAVPLFERFTDVIVKLGNGFRRLSPGARRFVLILGAILIGAGPVIAAIGYMITITAQLLSILITLGTFLLTNPIGWVILAIVAFVVLYKKVRWFRDAVNATVHAIADAFKWLGNAIVDAWGWIKTAVGNVIKWIGHHWKLLLFLMGGPILYTVVQLIIHNWDRIKSVFSAIANFVKDHWKTILSIMFPMIVPPILFIIKHFEMIKTAFHDAVGGLAHVFGSVWSAVRAAIVTAVNWVIDIINWMIEAYNNTAGRIPGVHEIDPIGHIGQRGRDERDAAQSAYQIGTAPIPNALTHPGILSPFPQRHRGRARAKTASLMPQSIGLGRLVPDSVIHVPVKLDGREIARVMAQHTDDDLARRRG